MLSRYLSRIAQGEMPCLVITQDSDVFYGDMAIHIWINWTGSSYLLGQGDSPWRFADGEIPF